MKVVCSYCLADLGEKEPLDDARVSHGVCGACRAHYRRRSLGEYLDELPCPVLVVDEDVRVLAANRRMAELLGRRPEDVAGVRGGEALDCVHARRPGGCGHQVHCRTCAIRNSVNRTFATGEPCVRVPAFLEHEDGRRALLVSTDPCGSFVQVVIESATATETVRAPGETLVSAEG